MRTAIRSLVIATGLALAAAAAFAGEVPFTKSAFDKALADGKPVVVDFAASWCPTCKAQKPIVQSLLKDAKRESLTVFVADYDAEVALKKQMNVTMQSTLVAFKGGKEVARSTGQTDRTALAELLDKTL